MNYGEIKKFDIANGIGIRVSLFVSGCEHHCKNCFNSMTWDYNYGNTFTEQTEKEIIEAMNKDYIDGLTLIGGEPFEPINQRGLLPFVKRVKELLPNKTIWCYSGFSFEDELLGKSRARCEVTDELLSFIDVLVDGRFIEAENGIKIYRNRLHKIFLLNKEDRKRKGGTAQ